MVRTAENGRTTFSVGDYRGGMVTADVEESTNDIVVSPDDDHRLASGELARNVLTPLPKLIDATDKLPRTGKYGAALKVEDSQIEVPVGRNRGRLS